jgi:uncharacterized surface protein with fasciclin (FAS1) repeats/outer membrane protein OmpA-like peptidoglycan-associated protein
VSFEGQDGRVVCAAPVLDPERALALAQSVRGVRDITLARSCRVSSAPTVVPDDPDATDDGELVDGDLAGSGLVDGTTGEATVPTTTEPPPFDSVIDVVQSDPQFSVFAALVAEAELVGLLASDGPFTVFAPDDAAFEALPADVLAELRQDPEVLAAVVRHHVLPGSFTAGQLETGAVEGLDGGVLDVVVSATGTVSVDDATIVDADLPAANGFVHVIDGVLVPGDLELVSLRPAPVVEAVLGRSGLVLAGRVVDPLQAAILREAAARALDPANIVDEIELDDTADVTTAAVTALARLVEAAPRHLAMGSIGFDGTSHFVRGAYVDEDARATLVELAADEGAALEVAGRAVADETSTAATEELLAQLVAEAPIEFLPNSAELTEQARAVLDLLAAAIKHEAGTIVTVEGYTDTSGTAAANQALSELRATAVLVELVLRGVPADDLEAVGLGQSRPIVVDGVEDPVASRRVEFRVRLAEPTG